MDEIPNLTRLIELLGFSEKYNLRLVFKRDYKEYWIDYWASWPAGERDYLDKLNWAYSTHRDLCAEVAQEFLDSEGRFERYWGVDNNLEGPWDWDTIHGLLTQFFFRASGQRKRWQISKSFGSRKAASKQAVGVGRVTSDVAHASDSSPTMAQTSTVETWARPGQPETRSSAAKPRALPADPSSSSPRLGSSDRGTSEVSGGSAAKATQSTHRSSNPVGTKRGMPLADMSSSERSPLEKRQRFTVADSTEGHDTTSSSNKATIPSGHDLTGGETPGDEADPPSYHEPGATRSCRSETADGFRPRAAGGQPRMATVTDPNQAPMAPMTPFEQPEPSEAIRVTEPPAPQKGQGDSQRAPRPAAVEKTASGVPPSRGRAVSCTFLVVISRAPQYVVEWEPSGRFGEMSLAEMVADLPLRERLAPSGLMFTLVAPDASKLGVSVPLGQEERFAGMKRKLARKMKSVGKRRPGAGALTFDILVEAVNSWKVHDDVETGTDDEGDLVWPGFW